jgi:hypothetical protein
VSDHTARCAQCRMALCPFCSRWPGTSEVPHRSLQLVQG